MRASYEGVGTMKNANTLLSCCSGIGSRAGRLASASGTCRVVPRYAIFWRLSCAELSRVGMNHRARNWKTGQGRLRNMVPAHFPTRVASGFQLHALLRRLFHSLSNGVEFRCLLHYHYEVSTAVTARVGRKKQPSPATTFVAGLTTKVGC
jgi:hypothetical protein